MKVAVFSTKPYDREFLTAAGPRLDFHFLEPRLGPETVVLADGCDAACLFVHDQAPAAVLADLHARGVRAIVLRCAGFNNVEVAAARALGMRVLRVPAYSPHAVAEHAVALMLALNRKIYRAYTRVREGNFALEGLLGFDMNGRTAGVVGTGRIGAVIARILQGFGCRVLAYDVHRNAALEQAGVVYAPLEELYRASDILTLHCPLMPETHHLIGKEAVKQMKRGAMLINTSRGALVDTPAVVAGLKSGRIGALGLDVYEEESELFFEDRSSRVIQDDVFSRLLTFPNVVITGHQAFFTREALANISATTVDNLAAIAAGTPSPNEV